jgi:hypothetical protein
MREILRRTLVRRLYCKSDDNDGLSLTVVVTFSCAVTAGANAEPEPLWIDEGETPRVEFAVVHWPGSG